MKKAKDCHSYFFVDESGDPTFYDKRGNLIVGDEGCSDILILGFIETPNPHSLRQAILKLQAEVINDEYLQKIPSLKKTAVSFHANKDAPEVRYLFYKLIKELDFKAQFVVARKIEKVFRNNFNGNEKKFYDHLISKLFRNVLHRHDKNYIYFSKRGSSLRQEPLEKAIGQAKEWFEEQNQTVHSAIDIQPQSPKGEPCLSIIDYMNWAVYRAYTKGEMRYYDFIADKVSLLVDLYDKKQPCRQNYYHRRNPFHINKITPLQLGSFTERTA